MDDPYQVPDGYPVKANASSGLYYMPDSALYEDTQAEIWFASEEIAQGERIPQGRVAGRPRRRQILRMTVTTLPSTAASLPGMGSKAGLWGISQTWPPVRLKVLTVASPSIIAATMSPLSATFC